MLKGFARMENAMPAPVFLNMNVPLPVGHALGPPGKPKGTLLFRI